MTVEKTFFSGANPANLGVVRVVVRELQLAGRGLSVAALGERLLVGGYAQNLAALGASLSVAVAIGSLEADGGVAEDETMVSPSDAAMGSTDPDGFAKAFLGRLGDYSSTQIAHGEAVPDLAYALAWVLRGDPRRPFSSWSGQKLNDPETAIETSGMSDVVSNSAQWNAFRRWVRSLGFVELSPVGTSSYVTADPTRCVGWHLGQLPDRCDAASFVESLRHLVPFMEGGEVGKALVKEFPDVPSSGADLGPAMSHALQRLEHEGRLELMRDEDAESVRLVSLSEVGFGQERVFGEVRIPSDE